MAKHRQSLYSIEFGASIDTIRSRTDTILDYDDREGGELSPKPMTPRRVKRRSIARGSNSRQSTTSRRSSSGGSGGGGTHSRSSMRASRRKYQQNPVTKLLDQQEQLQQHKHHSHRNYNNHHHPHHHSHSSPQQSLTKQQFGSFHHKDNSNLTISNLQTLNHDVSPSPNNMMTMGSGTANTTTGGSLTKTNNHYHNFRKNIPPDPIYYNTNGQAGLFHQSWASNSQSPIVDSSGGGGGGMSGGTDEPPTPTLVGHFNPTYQHSSTNLNDGEHVDELYNNRPPSVRSSYSNFHGTRPLSSYLPNTTPTTENVFMGLPGAGQQQQQQQHPHYPAPSTPPLYQQHPLHTQQNINSVNPSNYPMPPATNYPSSQPQNIPFAKRTASRESIRSMAFLNSGPPAYNLNYHTPPDSETTM